MKERSGGVAGVLDGVMDVWGRLLVGYGDIQGSADELMDEMIKGLGGGSGALGSIASWLGDTVSASVAALGLEPCDLRLRKPVLTTSLRARGLTLLVSLKRKTNCEVFRWA